MYGPAAASGVLLLYGLSDAIPDWVWPLPLTLLPLTLALAVAAYLSLGHALHGRYLVVRRGAVSRNTVALECGAVIGWRLEQTLFQRWGGRVTVGLPTAAGDRYYEAPDASVDQALAFVAGATPELAAQFIEDNPTTPDVGVGASDRRKSSPRHSVHIRASASADLSVQS
ncbi:PH domain-containing protein [Actinoplanes sp. NPDC024001]|uniref:PH domain-containing protein n=1 Tax=Actinoplanes sp. NPDC024001 TaxID=3154598 RepID=UPI003410DE16